VKVFKHIYFDAGNGKGVWKEMIKAAFGPYYGTMSTDAVVKTPGQPPASKGSPTHYLFALKDKRMVISDETDEAQCVDAALVLSTCSGGDIVARELYTKNVEFTLTHTPFIQTNNAPLLPPGTNPKADNFRRRIEVFRFSNTYVPADGFDPSNPDHRLANTGLKERMLAPDVLEQLLSLLARESVAYYNEGLGETPPEVVEATRAYFEDCDMLQRFLHEHCLQGTGLETLEHDFVDDYNKFSHEEIKPEALKKHMEGKGFKRSGKAVNVFGKRELYYPGVKSIYARS
jgi:phage/plasmid-associated DNA primase